MKTAIDTEKLLEAVETQRMKPLNILNLSTVMKAASATSAPPEMEGTLEILEESLRGVVEGFEEISLRRAIAAGSETEEELP